MASSGPANLIDTRHRGRERAIGVYDLGGVIVDPGPASCLETVLDGLGREPRALLLTHIHLDHAGATGVLVRRFPSLEVWVHERGAPHLVEPSKLLASAARLYGDEMDELWGEVAPVPQANVRPLAGGESLEVEGRRLEVRYAPGHASHHVVYLDPDDGTAYVGDVAGVRIPPSSFTMAPTPPPDIDVELWLASIAMLRELAPERLALTHFGFADDVAAQLDAVVAALERQAGIARELVEAGAPDAERRFAADLEQRLHADSDAETAAVALQASPPRQLWLGLKRYTEKRAPRSGVGG